MAAGDLYAALVEYLNACHAALADTPAGSPSCFYVSSGPPAWDSLDCLIVHAGGPAIADTLPLQPSLSTLHRATVQGSVNLVAMTATILRCAASMHDDDALPPTIAEQNAVAEQTSADLWAIWNYVQTAKRQSLLFPPREREFALEPPVAVNQQGGATGWQITIRTQLDGYQAAVAP
jgi:hypothetical protein